MKLTKIKQSPTSFCLPMNVVLAASQMVSKDEYRYHLCGVCIRKNDLDEIVVYSTDGHLAFKHELKDDHVVFFGDEIDNDELLIKMDWTEKGFKNIKDNVYITGDIETGIIEFLSIPKDFEGFDTKYKRVGVAEFSVIDATYPDIERVIPKQIDKSNSQHNVSIDLNYMKNFIGVYKALNKGVTKTVPVQFNTTGSSKDPLVVKFSNLENTTCVLMPIKF